jgi:hypothetical protein
MKNPAAHLSTFGFSFLRQMLKPKELKFPIAL